MQQQQTQEEEEAAKIGERLTASLSFRRVSQEETRPDSGSPKELPAAELLPAELLYGLDREDEDGGHDDDDDVGREEDFEFAFADRASFDGLEGVTADEIFSDGLIRPVYPLFDRALVGDASASPGEKEKHAGLPLRLRKLMLEDGDTPSASSSESEGLGGIPAESYCVWAPGSAPPSPDLSRKSHSAGAASKWGRLCSLVVRRSHSDGKERLVFLENPGPKSKKKAEGPPEAEKKGRGKGRGGGRVTEMDIVTAHRLYYARGGAAAAGYRHRSFLPYRKDLLGFFANGNGHGTFQPF